MEGKRIAWGSEKTEEDEEGLKVSSDEEEGGWHAEIRDNSM